MSHRQTLKNILWIRSLSWKFSWLGTYLDNAFSYDLISHRTPLSPQSSKISASDQLCIRSRKNHKFYDLEYKTKIVPLRENFLNLLKGPKRNGNTQKSGCGGRKKNINSHRSITIYMLVMLKYVSLTQISPLRFKPTCLGACWHFYSDVSPAASIQLCKNWTCFLPRTFTSCHVLCLSEWLQMHHVTKIGWALLRQVGIGWRERE